MNDSPNNPENNDPEISASLRRIVPDDLTTGGLVAGARSKRRRLHGVVGVVAALVLVAVAVPVALNLPTNDTLIAEPAVTSASPSPSVKIEDPERAFVLPGAQACYNDDRTPINHSQDTNGPAQPGAVKAWLCGDYSQETGAGFIGPHEPLTSGIDELLEGMQSEPEVDLAVISCPAEYNLSFNVVLEYEDGTRSIVGGDRHGCRLTYDGGVAREDGDKFYGEAVSAWETQRETDDGDWVVPHICPGPLSLIEMERSDVVQASVCGDKEDGSWGAVYLEEDLVGEISEDLAASYAAHAENDFVEVPEQRVWLTLSDKFTDYQTFVRHEDGRYHAYDGEGRKWFWKPSEELSVKLDEALAGAGETDAPPAGMPVDAVEDPGPDDPVLQMPMEGQGWISEGCQGVTSEDALTSDLPNGELPEDAERIWLCAGDDFQAGIAPPMEALEEQEWIRPVVAAFNELDPMPADLPCTMELGSSWLVVHEYSDGTKYTVKAETFGCGSVQAGDTVKMDRPADSSEDGEPDSYIELIMNGWYGQRALRDTVQARPGPLCSIDSFIENVHPEKSTFTSGVACLWTDGEGYEGPASEKALPAGMMPPLADLLFAARPMLEEDVQPSGDSLVVLNEFGDPLKLQRQVDGTFFFDSGLRKYIWIPEGEIAGTLADLFER